VVLVIVGCGASSSRPEGASARATPPSPAPDASASHLASASAASSVGAPAPSSSGATASAPRALPRYERGRFEALTTYREVAPNDECLHVFPGFIDLAATAKGAFVVGACGVRLRFEGTKPERFATPTKTMTILPGFTCQAHRLHWSIWAPSHDEAFVLGTPRCGPDPSAVWPNELERFDGKRWMPIRATFGAGDPHESDAARIDGAEGTLYAIVAGDPWHGPPDNAITRLAGTRVEELRSALGQPMRALLARAHADPTANAAALPNEIPYEGYGAIEVLGRDHAWVAGGLHQYVQRNQDGHGEPVRLVSGTVWELRGKVAAEYRVDDESLSGIAVAPDGTVFAVGDGLWRKRPSDAGFERIARGWNIDELGWGAKSVVAPRADDVWIALGCGGADCAGPIVVHYDGAQLTRVEVAWPANAPDDGRGSRWPRVDAVGDGPVWLMGEQLVWRLSR
jgi:hypothetical protein